MKDKTTLRELNGDWVEITTPTLTDTQTRYKSIRAGKTAVYLLGDDS